MQKRVVVSLDSWLREQQIGEILTYQTDGYSWELVDEFPKGTVILVRAEGLDWVRFVNEGLQQFNEEKSREERTVMYVVGRRKDDLTYRCQPESRQELSDYLKTLSPPQPPEPPNTSGPRRHTRRITSLTAYHSVA